jgi:two-component system, cell cycle sensor histidine kinase and response regulator CckA
MVPSGNRTKHFYQYLIIFSLFLSNVIPTSASWAWAGQSKHVLVLHSYHKGLTWTDSITRGIEARFEKSGIPIEIEYAYMDTKRIFNQAYIEQLVELYRVKYHKRKFDAVISSDDHAFKFLLRNHSTLFGDTPIIFCGVNYFQDEMIQGKPNFTGVLESFDMLKTVNAALDLQPQAKRLIAIGDQTVSGIANKKRFEEIIPRIKRPVDITILNNHTMAEIQSYVGGLSAQDIVIWLVFTADRNGQFFSFEQSSQLISNHSAAPMYSFWDFNIGHGIVGGMLTSGINQGERAADLGLRILNGEPVSQLPVIKKSPNQYVFDNLQMERFGLRKSLLPAGSQIINQPTTFYSQNQQIFWSVLIIFCSMTTIIIALLLSIASRRKVERALVASKDRYQNVFYSTAVALFEADFSSIKDEIDKRLADGEIDFRLYLEKHPEVFGHLIGSLIVKDVNPAAVSLFQASDNSKLLNALPQILHDQSTTFKAIIIAMANGRDHLVWEDTFKTLEYESIHVIISLNFPNDPDSYSNIVASVFDITDRRLSEEALRRSEDRFRTVFNQAASGMALIDLDGTYLRVNSSLCQMIGYSERELLHLTWRDIIPEEDIDLSLAQMEYVLAGKLTHPVEKRYLHKKGQVVHVLFNLAAIFNKEHRPLYFIAQVQNITQIKTAQAKLEEREERYRQFFEGSLSGVYLAEPDGKVIVCNEVFAEILGFNTIEEVIGTNFREYYKDPHERTQLVEQFIRDKHLEQIELDMIRKDGAPVQCLLNAIGRFSKQGELIEIQGYLMDITRMKSLEAQLLHAQKMESIGTMAGGVAHDFNNLLMGIMGNTSLMLIKKDRSEKDYQRLKSIEQLVQSGSDLTRQLLGFAKGGKYEVRTTDLNKLIDRSIKMFGRTHKEIQIQTALAEDLRLVEADRSQIDQVLYNLYLNAWQAMDNDGGQISVRTRNIHIRMDAPAPYGLAPGDYVEVSVQDDGMGMDDKTQQRIFDPFFTTKERERGTGLGLASAYGIIQNHAGLITVKSKPMEGSCFTLFLPATKKTMAETPPKSSPRLIQGSETILLVDDEQGVLDAVGAMIRHLGYTVWTAADRQTAIEQLHLHHDTIDLVILDMVMPGISGKEVFERFKQIDPDVKVLLCSGYAADGQAADILKRGCMGFIQKPFTISQLSEKLGQVIHNNN